MELVKTSSHSLGCHFVLLIVSFVSQKLFSFMRSHLLISDLSAYPIIALFRKLFLMPMCLRLFPTFSSIMFSVFDFMLRLLIHMDLSSLQCDRYKSICIFLHADNQLHHHHLLKLLSFFQYVYLASLSKIITPQVCGFVQRSLILVY